MVDIASENRVSPQITNSQIAATKISSFSAQFELLLKKYQTDIQSHPADDKLLAQRARLYIKLAKSTQNKNEQQLIFQLALHDYEDAIRLTQQKADYYSERADVYHYLKHFEQAVADCMQAERLSPLNTRFQEKLKRLQLLKKQAAVVRFLKSIKTSINIMMGGILIALVGAVIWGTGQILYGLPFITLALIGFVYGVINVLKNEIKLYELQRQ